MRRLSDPGIPSYHTGSGYDDLPNQSGATLTIDARKSPFYAWLDHATIRDLVRGAQQLSAGERLILIKGLIPALVDDVGEAALDRFLGEMRIKAQRYAEALAHPGEGGAARNTASEPLGGPIEHGEARLPGTRDPRRPGGRALERQWEAEYWNEIFGASGERDAAET